MSDHSHYEELAALLAGGFLSDEELMELREHAKDCVECQKAEEEFTSLVRSGLQQAVSSLRQFVDVAKTRLDNGVRSGFLQRARSEVLCSLQASKDQPVSRKASWFLRCGRDAMATAIVLVAFFGTRWIADRMAKRLNPAAFAPPAAGQTGNFPRNGLRSPYSINQTDLALRRQFSLTERVRLDLRAEYFNVFNHPMFEAPGSECAPDTVWGNQTGPAFSSFGKVCSRDTANVNDGLNGQSALYAAGGSRSAQFTIRLRF
jgi:hypothetical protein